MSENGRNWKAGLGLIVLAATALRLWPLIAGAPVWHPDEYSLVFFPLNFYNGDLNPHFFTYPTLHYYLLAAAYALLFLAQQVWGAGWPLLEWVAYHYFWDPAALMSVARIIGVGFAVATVVWAAFLAHRIAGAGAALVTALVLAVNVLHLRQSVVACVDVPMALWATAAVWAAVRLLHCARARDYALAGLLMGLAASCKYPAAALAPALLAAHVLAQRALWDRRLWVAAGAALLAFALTSPYVLLDFAAFKAHFLSQVAHASTGRGQGGVLFHAGFSLRYGVGTLAWLATLAALAWAFYRSSRAQRVVLVAFFSFYAAISWGQLAFVRYALPLLVLQAVLLGVAWGQLPRRSWRYVLVLVLLAEPLYGSWRLVQIQGATDTRTAAQAWIEAEVPAGARIANFGGWAGDVPLLTVDEIWWRLRHFEGVFSRERLVELLPFLEQTRPPRPLYRYLVQEGDVARQDGDWSLVAEREVAYILTHAHPLSYSRLDSIFIEELHARAEHLQRWEPQGLTASLSYDLADAYYVPLGDWGALRQPGPLVELWRVGAQLEPARVWSTRQLLALAYVKEHGFLSREGAAVAAAEALQHALDLGGESSEALYALGEMSAAELQFAAARRAYERIKELEPLSWRPYKALGALYLKMGENAAALAEMERAVELGGQTSGLYNNLGIANVRLGQLQRGKLFLRRVVEMAPERVDSWYNLGMALDLGGQRAAAVEALQHALMLDPEHRGARDLLQVVGTVE